MRLQLTKQLSETLLLVHLIEPGVWGIRLWPFPCSTLERKSVSPYSVYSSICAVPCSMGPRAAKVAYVLKKVGNVQSSGKLGWKGWKYISPLYITYHIWAALLFGLFPQLSDRVYKKAVQAVALLLITESTGKWKIILALTSLAALMFVAGVCICTQRV